MGAKELFDAVIGPPLVEDHRTLVDTAKRRILARNYKDSAGETTFFGVYFERGCAALSIIVKTQPDGREELQIGTWLIDAKDYQSIHLFSWSTADHGKRSSSISSVGVGLNRNKYRRMAEKGHPQYTNVNELPYQINVEKAVGHWLGRIDDCITNSQELKTLGLSIQETVGQFRV